MNPPTLTFMTNADDQRSLKTERLGEVLGRVVWRLTTQRNSGSAFNGSSQDDERGATAGRYAPTVAGGRRGVATDQGENVGEAAVSVTSTDSEPGPSIGDRAFLYGETARHTPRGGLTGRASHFPAAQTKFNAAHVGVRRAAETAKGRLTPMPAVSAASPRLSW